MSDKIILSTTENISGKINKEILGVVKGSTIRSHNVIGHIGAELKSLIGGEIRGYSSTLVDAREYAERQLLEQAEELGADAVVCVRYTTSQVKNGAAEILVYGTAVRLG